MDLVTSIAIGSGIIVGSLFGFGEFRLANRLAVAILAVTLLFLVAIGIFGDGIFFLFFGSAYLGFYIGLPAYAAFGIVKATRYFHALPPPRCGHFWSKFRLIVLCGFGLGLIYLLYAIGLTMISQNIGSGSVVENSAVNYPLLWLMLMFGADKTLDTTQTSPLEIGLVFVIIGTLFYAVLGAGAGFIADSLRLKNKP